VTGAGGATISLFRAIGLAELADIEQTGGFRPGPGVMETKLFVTSVGDAARFGQLLYTRHGEEFAIVEAVLVESLAGQLDRFVADSIICVAVYPEQLVWFNSVAEIRVPDARS
jgi:hypothetical protein